MNVAPFITLFQYKISCLPRKQQVSNMLALYERILSLIKPIVSAQYTVSEHQCHTPSREERRFLYFNHLSKECLEKMIPHLKALI